MESNAVNGNYWTGFGDSAAAGAKKAANATDVSKDDFLQLLVAQLKNQNPLEPVKNEDFLAQLASFSSLEQLIAIKQGVDALAGITTDDSTSSTDTSNQSA